MVEQILKQATSTTVASASITVTLAAASAPAWATHIKLLEVFHSFDNGLADDMDVSQSGQKILAESPPGTNPLAAVMFPSGTDVTVKLSKAAAVSGRVTVCYVYAMAGEG